MPPNTVAAREFIRPTMAAAIAGITRKVNTVGFNRTMLPMNRPLMPANKPARVQAQVSTFLIRTPTIALNVRLLCRARMRKPKEVFASNHNIPTVAAAANISAATRV